MATRPLSPSQNPAKPEAESDQKIVSFRPPEVTQEDRAAALQAVVERLARQQPVERLFFISSSAEQHGIKEAKLKEMVEAQVRANEKIKRDAKSEERKSEQRAEKQRISERRDQERQQRQQRQADEKAEKESERKAKRKQRERTKEFAKLLLTPAAEHEPRLVALAKRLGEDVKFLRSEFTQFVELEEASKAAGLVEPWPHPVETGALLIEVRAQVRRYVVVHSDAETTAIVLWIFLAWVHEAAVHSPLLIISASDGDEGKTTLCGTISFLTPRAYCGAELTGPNLYRFVDHVHPTLIIDDADNLLPRKPDLVHVINASWTRGTKVPRQDHGVTRWFDVFCPKVIAGVRVQLPATTASRRIPIRLWPKLSHEEVAKFEHCDDDTFSTLRRKLARWALDNFIALKSARPTMPAEMINRLEDNWKVQLAIADLAGGEWPEAALEAATKLSQQQQRAPSDGKRLLAAFRNLFAVHGSILTSANAQKLLTADPAGEWADYHGHPITQREIALLLDGYEIHPDVIRPPKGKPDRGYRAEWFAKAFLHYLQKPIPNRTTVTESRKSRRNSRCVTVVTVERDQMTKIRSNWTPNMEQRSSEVDGRQVKCLMADAGHVWIHYYDDLPPPVRRRLSESAFNICPACLQGEARRAAAAQRLCHPTISIYIALIERIEKQLGGA